MIRKNPLPVLQAGENLDTINRTCVLKIYEEGGMTCDYRTKWSLLCRRQI